MLLLSGVFFPVTQLPEIIARHVTQALPLYHAVELIRLAMLGRPLDAPAFHALVLIACDRVVSVVHVAVQEADDEVRAAALKAALIVLT